MSHLMTTKEVAKYLKLSTLTTLRYAKSGKLPAIKVGSVWRFDKDILDKWIAKGMQ